MSRTNEIEPVFVDRDVRVHHGEAARTLLEETNDLRFYEAGRGVVRVDERRWSDAQRYERKTWMELGLRQSDDRNREHVARFGGYEALRGRTFQRAIELGCGPFTNMRLILEIAEVDEVHLLDPLVLDYVEHPLCRYRGGRLGGLPGPVTLLRLLTSGNPFRKAREIASAVRVGGFSGRPVVLEPSTIEEFMTDRRFDLVVMINVIEHCRDLNGVLEKIDRLLEPGGVFVFHDRLWNPDALESTLETLYDAGHPLRVGRGVVTDYLETRFEALASVENAEVADAGGHRFPRTELHFIGRRRA